MTPCFPSNSLFVLVRMNKVLIGSLVVTVLALGGIWFLRDNRSSNPPVNADLSANVTMVDGKQVIQMTAKGGYAPRVTAAKADVPTVIQMETNGTYDCSIALAVPALGFRKNLPATGVTQIDVPAQRSGTVLKGVCSMGMYNFTIRFN